MRRTFILLLIIALSLITISGCNKNSDLQQDSALQHDSDVSYNVSIETENGYCHADQIKSDTYISAYDYIGVPIKGYAAVLSFEKDSLVFYEKFRISSDVQLYLLLVPCIELLDNEVTVETLLCRQGEPLSLPSPQKTGYKFLYWADENGVAFVSDTMPDRGCSLSARWEIEVYSIEYRLGGAINSEYNPISYTIEDKIVLAAPASSPENNAFAGWFSDEAKTQKIDKLDGKSGNLVLFADWTAVSASMRVRDSVVLITDSGRAKQHVDVIRLDNYFSMDKLKKLGYKTVKVQISMRVAEVQDGYQWVFLYDSPNVDAKPESSNLFDRILTDLGEGLNGLVSGALNVSAAEKVDRYLLSSARFEHGSGYKDTTWGTVNITLYALLDRLDSSLYIRYGASGKQDDDWKNSEVQVTLTVLK